MRAPQAQGLPPPFARSAIHFARVPQLARASTNLGEAGALRDGWGQHLF
jgi:hypothetical protein